MKFLMWQSSIRGSVPGMGQNIIIMQQNVGLAALNCITNMLTVVQCVCSSVNILK
jgi:hypothetical protein